LRDIEITKKGVRDIFDFFDFFFSESVRDIFSAQKLLKLNIFAEESGSDK